MRTVKLVIAFDGTRYEGWQSQRNHRTLQEVFERTLSRLFKRPTAIVGCSRTDSGVHALGFVAHFKTDSRLSDQAIQNALNFYLPRDIVVSDARTVAAGFHARYDARSKVYRYTILTTPVRPIFGAPYVYWYPQPLDITAMKQAALHLKGRHDFKSFSNKDDERSYVRTIQKISVTKRTDRIFITIQADGFLKQMVRIIVGTLIEAGRGKMTPADMKKILKARNRDLAGPTAKPQGLALVKARY